MRRLVGALTPSDNRKTARFGRSVVYGRPDTSLLVYNEIRQYHTQTDPCRISNTEDEAPYPIAVSSNRVGVGIRRRSGGAGECLPVPIRWTAGEPGKPRGAAVPPHNEGSRALFTD